MLDFTQEWGDWLSGTWYFFLIKNQLRLQPHPMVIKQAQKPF
jgi:hypothetical protein